MDSNSGECMSLRVSMIKAILKALRIVEQGRGRGRAISMDSLYGGAISHQIMIQGENQLKSFTLQFHGKKHGGKVMIGGHSGGEGRKGTRLREGGATMLSDFHPVRTML
jgi:hypothetical protein